MIEKLAEAQPNSQFGGKINALLTVRDLGGNIPAGLILSEELVSTWWRPQLNRLLEQYTLDQITPDIILKALPISILPDHVKKALADFLEEGKTYIVRSSALLEDGLETSFAGQYESVLDCRTLSDIEEAIRTCIGSLFTAQSLAYWSRHDFNLSQLGLALLVQEQVAATVSGVCFSLDPQSAQDQTLLIEYIDGQGKALVDGSRNPYQIRLPWYGELDFEADLQSQTQLEQLRRALMPLLSGFGLPIDVEFSFLGNELYLLQARPITALSPKSRSGRWTTANYRDGGVAAQPCPNLMFSLYRQAWQTTLTRFMEEAHLVKKGSLGSLIQLNFARPYWNLGAVKVAMEQIPGYIERDFDDELGVEKNYTGEGYRTRLSPKSVLHVARVALSLKRITANHRAGVKALHQTLLIRYQELTQNLQAIDSREGMEKLWMDLVNQAHLEAEGSYFWQVFINTVQLSMKKTALLKWLSPSTFFDLIAHLGKVSHLEPLEAILDLVEKIEQEPAYLNDWETKSVRELVQICQAKPDRPDSRGLKAFQEQFGYHSERELNLLVPSYSEDVGLVISQVQHFLLDRDKTSYLRESLRDKGRANQAWSELKTQLTAKQYAKVDKLVTDLRDLLWWRESFKDISTRYYHLVRQASLKLGQFYLEEGFLKESEDVFYLEKEEIATFIKGQLSAFELQERATANRHYCQSYQNFEPPGDLYEERVTMPSSGQATLQGLPANGGSVTARVRVLEDMADIQLLEKGEILVTRFTDTGWSYAFGSLAGLVTEYGGVLCHASIVARECQLPALVCVKGATKRLKTGMLITLDANAGTIIIHEEEIC